MRIRVGFGAHTRTIQARHMVRGLMSETSLMGISNDKNQQVGRVGFRVEGFKGLGV